MTSHSLVETLIHQARSRGLTLAVAESLTGGLVAARIVDVPGASEVFMGGVVAYHASLKHTLLGVDPELLAAGGAVQEEVAVQMARGARERCATLTTGTDLPRHADIAVATTGVAGPEADVSTGQQPGVVWLAVSSDRGDRAKLFHFTGDRQGVREACVQAALRMLSDEVLAFS